MTKQDLMPFCALPGYTCLPEIEEPFSRGDFTIATNGHLLIRVLRLADVPNETGPDVDKLFRSAMMPNEWFSVPDTGPPMIGTCIWCKGKSGGCDECNFTGKDELYTPVSVAEQCFQAKYLRLLRTLPGAEIGPTYEMNAARFRFDGGDGLIMPCKDEA